MTAVALDASGVATMVGITRSKDFPLSKGAFDSVSNSTPGARSEGFITQLDMGVDLRADVHEITFRTGGSQSFSLNAGKAHAGQTYWLAGSATGTSPGTAIGAWIVPLNVDAYFNMSIANRNSTTWSGTHGTLDVSGQATASLNVPRLGGIPPLTLHHAYVVFDKLGNPVKVSQAVPVRLR